MTTTIWVLVIVAALAGVASGPSALSAANASQPPLDWPSIAFIFAGAAAALFIVLGFQGFLRKNKAVALGWNLFALSTVYMAASGIAALFISLAQGSFGPPSVLFLALATACTLSLVAVRKTFPRAFRSDA